jgi:hypothetical protein
MLGYRQTGYLVRSGLAWLEYGSRSQTLHQNCFV